MNLIKHNFGQIIITVIPVMAGLPTFLQKPALEAGFFCLPGNNCRIRSQT
ncbi:hypothetical protein PSYJA_27679 [Pseudomonas syringae pv. japonica str. M301072]|uniref:Uncharacterized protein n=1 Tax=Pseudomonas syringae pv. japonica str. M301072 TaxID=629262 RepID=F3FQQ0_PSESX|nr:hypothetical protein PSYJA_27679 [Pseudomonas syringae pv. japonica str. M301072]